MDKNWDLFKTPQIRENERSNNVSDSTTFSLNRLNRDLSSYPSEKFVSVDESIFKEFTENGKRVVRKMPLDLFRQCLINHFDIRFKTKSIQWPKHIKNKQSKI